MFVAVIMGYGSVNNIDAGEIRKGHESFFLRTMYCTTFCNILYYLPDDLNFLRSVLESPTEHPRGNLNAKPRPHNVEHPTVHTGVEHGMYYMYCL